MKKFLVTTVVVIVVAAAGLYTFREPLLQAVGERLTANMFVDTDDADYDPGTPEGEVLPAIQARYDGRTVTDLTEFAGPNGLVLLANRSVDW